MSDKEIALELTRFDTQFTVAYLNAGGPVPEPLALKRYQEFLEALRMDKPQGSASSPGEL